MLTCREGYAATAKLLLEYGTLINVTYNSNGRSINPFKMEKEIMKIIIFTLCIFIAFMPSAYAGELYKCMDSKGNPIITGAPQDGMINCAPEISDEDSSPKNNITSQKGTGKKTMEELIHDAIQFQAI
jgi:hypothetical protein